MKRAPSKHEAPPGPAGSAIFGVAVDFWRDSLGSLQRWTEEYGDAVHFRTGPYVVHIYFLNRPSYIRDVLARQADAFVRPELIRHFLGTFLGNGVLLSNGPEHERQRRMISPALSPAMVKTYAACMVDCVEDMLARWQPGAVVDINREMMALALRIGCKTLFGKDGDDIGEFVAQASHEAQSYINRIFRSLVPIPIWVPTPRNRSLSRRLKEGNRVIMDIIANRRRAGGGETDLLSMMLREQAGGDGHWGDDKDIRDQVATLSMVGHETTATALTWAWYLLATHPEIQDRLAAEVRRVAGEAMPAYEHVPKLTYAKMIFSEALRLYPPVWIFSRTATRDVELEDLTIPRGTTVAVSPYITQRDPRFFEDPLVFRPERFAPSAAEKIDRYTYFPFGAGQRGCLGEYFAVVEGVLILSAVTQRCRMTLVPGQTIETDPMITLRPRDGIRVRVEERMRKAVPLEARH